MDIFLAGATIPILSPFLRNGGVLILNLLINFAEITNFTIKVERDTGFLQLRHKNFI